MKQRLVGALVLLCLGVVLWSLLFTGNPMRSVDPQTQIPETMRIDAEPPGAPRQPSGVKPLSDSWVPKPDPEYAAAPSSQPKEEEERQVEPQQVKPTPPVTTKQSESSAKVATEPKAPVAKKAETQKAAINKPEPEKTSSKPAAKKSPPSKAELDESRILPVAWVVQVASFRSEASADALKKKLQLRAFKAYVEKQSLSGRPLYRVMIGPKLSKAQAQEIRDQVEKEFRLKGLVMRFKR